MPTKDIDRWTSLNLLHICIRSQADLRGHRLGLPALDQDVNGGSLGSPRPCQGSQGFGLLRVVFPQSSKTGRANWMGIDFFGPFPFSCTSVLKGISLYGSQYRRRLLVLP